MKINNIINMTCMLTIGGLSAYNLTSTKRQWDSFLWHISTSYIVIDTFYKLFLVLKNILKYQLQWNLILVVIHHGATAGLLALVPYWRTREIDSYALMGSFLLIELCTGVDFLVNELLTKTNNINLWILALGSASIRCNIALITTHRIFSLTFNEINYHWLWTWCMCSFATLVMAYQPYYILKRWTFLRATTDAIKEI